MSDTDNHLTKEELAGLFRAITDARDRAMFRVAYWRGLRASEIGRLTLAAFNPKEGRLKFSRLKGSKGGNDILSPEELKYLKAWLKVRGSQPGPLFPSNRGKGISRQQVYVLVRKYGEAAGLPKGKCHPHILKHSIASHLAKRDVPALKIQKWLGHSSFNSTQHYLHIEQQDQDATAREIYSD